MLDIETRPNLAYVWGLWEQNVALNQIDEICSVICWAAKWTGEKRVQFASDHHHGHEQMVTGIYDLMSEADAIITFNGRSFDIPHLNREFLLAGLTPPSPHVDIDLYLASKRRFKWQSNKLAHIAAELGLGAKTQHTGFDLWRQCMAGDDKAWELMRRYNMQDVRLTEKLYDRLLPWIPSHPNRRLYDSPHGCPTCGSDDLMRRGVAYTRTGQFQQWRCGKCGGYFRSSRRITGTDTQQVAV